MRASARVVGEWGVAWCQCQRTRPRLHHSKFTTTDTTHKHNQGQSQRTFLGFSFFALPPPLPPFFPFFPSAAASSSATSGEASVAPERKYSSRRAWPSVALGKERSKKDQSTWWGRECECVCACA